ncbi:MAG: DUF6798 domain-containing protein [Pseudomonadota bacterium]
MDKRPINISPVGLMINILLLVITTAFFLFLNGGIDVGSSNHHGLIPVVRRILDPLHLPGDFGIELRWHHHQAYAYLVAALTWAMGEVWALVALKVGQTFLLAAGLWLLCRALGINRAGFLLVALMAATKAAWTGLGLEINSFIGNPEAQPPTLAHAMILLAVAGLIKRRIFAAALFFGLATLVHTQIGLVFSAVAFPIFVALTATVGKQHIRVASVAAGLWLIPALISAVPVLSAIQQGALDSSGYFTYVAFRMPHHFELKSIKALIWLLFHALLVTAVFLYFKKQRLGDLLGPRVLFYLTLSLCFVAALHFADYYLLEWGVIAKLQAIRLSPFISVFGILMLVFFIQKSAEETVVLRFIRLRKADLLPMAGLLLGIAIGMHWDRYLKTWDSGIQVATDADNEWVDMARWVRENGEKGMTYLTPPGLNGFAYLAERSPVAEFKINPDGSRYLDQWTERLTDLSGGSLPEARGFQNRRLLDRHYFALKPTQLAVLGQKYGAEYAIVHAHHPLFKEAVYQNKALKLVKLAVKSVTSPSEAVKEPRGKPSKTQDGPRRSKTDLILPPQRDTAWRRRVTALHDALERKDFPLAASVNAGLAREASYRAIKTLKAWESVRDPETGLVPRALRPNMAFWNPKDTAADLFPFLLIAGQMFDPDSEELWLDALATERAISGSLPKTIRFQPTRVIEDSPASLVFGASEYAKDGLLAVAERSGRGAWFDRLEEIMQALIAQASVSTARGPVPSSNAEVNGEILQVLARLHHATGKEEYLQMAERITEAYLFDVIPAHEGLPPEDWRQGKKNLSSSRFRLRDHGSEVIPGLAEVYLLETILGRPQADRYREPLKRLLDEVLVTGRTEDGLWVSSVDIRTREPVDETIADTWGYVLNAYQMFDLAEGISLYSNEVERTMRAAAALRSYPWHGQLHDGYADSIESMLNLLPWHDDPEFHRWVDDEIESMFAMQSESGFVEEGYLDGNFIRTALLYAQYKTRGINPTPWREDVSVGAAMDKEKGELHVHVDAESSWTGRLKFDQPRHEMIWNLPFDYPRLNASPEWNVFVPHRMYSVQNLELNETLLMSGKALSEGLPVSVPADGSPVRLVVSEDNSR